MDNLAEIPAWLQANYEGLAICMALILTGLEGFMRLLPTKSNQSGLERAGVALRVGLDKIKVPNVKRGADKFIDGKH